MPRKSWWARLPFGVRMAAGGIALLITLGGGVAGVAALTRGGGTAPRIVTEVGQAGAAPSVPSSSPSPVLSRPRAARPRAAAVVPRERETPDRAVPRRTSAPAATPGESMPAPPAGPVLTTRIEVETREIPYETRLVRDPALPRGSRTVQSPGVPGVQTLRYRVTLTDGRPTERTLIDAVVTRQPEHRVVALGTRRDPLRGPKPAGNCGEALNFCVPLGRSATCPREEDAILPALDELAYLEGLAC